MAESRKANSAKESDVQSLVDQAMKDAQTSLDQVAQVVAETAEPPVDEALPLPEPRNGIDLLSDVELDVSIELGRTEMLVEDVLRLSEGTVVELDKLAGDPVDVFVNQRLIARGEVLVLNDNFCIRISEIVADLEAQAEQAARQQGSAG